MVTEEEMTQQETVVGKERTKGRGGGGKKKTEIGGERKGTLHLETEKGTITKEERSRTGIEEGRMRKVNTETSIKRRNGIERGKETKAKTETKRGKWIEEETGIGIERKISIGPVHHHRHLLGRVGINVPSLLGH